jgi:hypothetical protein
MKSLQWFVLNSWPPIIESTSILILHRGFLHLSGLSEVVLDRVIANEALPWVVSEAIAGVLGAKATYSFLRETGPNTTNGDRF